MRAARAVLVIAVLSLAVSAPAMAGGGHYHGGGHGGYYHGGGYGGHYHGHSNVYWGISLGWPYYYYPPYPSYYPNYYPNYYPYYPYYGGAVVVPSGPTTYVERQDQAAPSERPASSWWYYCPESKTYYPYVKQCPGGWQKVEPQPPAQ